MRVIYVAIVASVFALAAGCTKKNPNLCCTDAADCEAQGLPDDAQCGDGLVCRGNQCIAETCSTASDCDAAAPYCLLDQGRCAEACTDDAQCPGFGQDASATFCVGGACVACREGMSDCPMEAPVCDTGACRICRANTECASGICGANGACVDDSLIAFVAPNGSAVSDCSRLSPCTLPQSIAVAPARAFIELADGTYALTAALVVAGNRRFVGASTARPRITRSNAGDVLQIAAGADASFEHLEVFGATAANPAAHLDGDGINCNPVPHTNGGRTVRMSDSLLDQNQNAGFQASGCTVFATHTTFSNNMFDGYVATDSSNVVDGCSAIGNIGSGFNFDAGDFTLTNSFSARNAIGVDIFVGSGQVGAKMDFDTIVDNGNAITGTPQAPVEVANNIIARNGAQNACAMCNFIGTLLLSDVASLHFVSPDAAPFDYHIGPGSVAIDGATASITVPADFDGEARPKGNAMDVGADEAQ